ncbi:DegT/DnrJ/EryC1/StrS family aminotransferase, partial [Brevibacillus agri]|nr:DegT/DnrJ/EryC1/StrS family aminotransferase [Brevibacillus agri]
PEAPTGRATRWLTALTVDPQQAEVTAGQLIDALERANIEARPVWKPMHRQPLFAGCRYYPHLPEQSVSDELYARGVCLPSGSSLSEQQQERVIAAIRQCLSGRGRAKELGHVQL